MTKFATKIVLTSAAAMFAFEVQAQTMGYFLPKVIVGGLVTQRIEHCPSGLGDDIYPLIITTTAVKSTYVPDDYVEISAKSGFLAQRSVEINLRSDGTLKSINASSEGQGAEVLGAVVKVAAGIAGFSGGGLPVAASLLKSTGQKSIEPAWMLAPPKPKPHLECESHIAKKVSELHKLRRDVDNIASDIANDRPISERALEIAEGQQARIADLEDELTQIIKVKAFAPATTRNDQALNESKIYSERLAAFLYSKWFSNPEANLLKQAKILGRDGFEFSISVNKTIFNRMRSLGVEELPPTSKNIVYLRAIPATASLEVADDESASAQAVAAEAKFDIPQFSRYFTLPAGSGGIFGTREAKVELSDSGTPTLLSYGAKGAGADIGTLTDTSLKAAEDIRDAKTEALKRAAERLQAQQDLLDLIEKANEKASNGGDTGG